MVLSAKGSSLTCLVALHMCVLPWEWFSLLSRNPSPPPSIQTRSNSASVRKSVPSHTGPQRLSFSDIFPSIKIPYFCSWVTWYFNSVFFKNLFPTKLESSVKAESEAGVIHPLLRNPGEKYLPWRVINYFKLAEIHPCLLNTQKLTGDQGAVITKVSEAAWYCCHLRISSYFSFAMSHREGSGEIIREGTFHEAGF